MKVGDFIYCVCDSDCCSAIRVDKVDEYYFSGPTLDGRGRDTFYCIDCRPLHLTEDQILAFKLGVPVEWKK